MVVASLLALVCAASTPVAPVAQPVPALVTAAAPSDADSAAPRWYWAQDDERLALRGYDPVAYHLLGSPQPGSAELEVEHAGLRYRFANDAHRARFLEDAERWLPEYGGWCALSLSVEARPGGWPPRRIPADPENFLVDEDGALLLFARFPNWDARVQWLAAADDDPAAASALRARADAFWASRVELGERFPSKPEGMHRLAPMETAQFDWFIGTWDSSYSFRVSPDSEQRQGPVQGIWKAYYGFDGFAIYDDWNQVGVVGASGPAIRSFDPVARHWVMTYMPLNAPHASHWRMEGRFDERGELHALFESVDPQGRAFLQRVHFENITADAFRWSSDRSYDDGATWIEDWGVGHNTRASGDRGE